MNEPSPGFTLILGIALIGVAIFQLNKAFVRGSVRGRRGIQYSRQDQPTEFWFIIGIQIALFLGGAAMTIVGVMEFLGVLKP